MYVLYSLLTAAGMLLLSPYFLVRGLISRKYLGSFTERMGWRFPNDLRKPAKTTDAETIWIHAVSVGEVLAAVPLVTQLKSRRPASRLVVSTTTATGQKLARERLGFADAIFYFPLDWTGPVRRALNIVRPDVVLVVETEIWPNFLRETRRAHVPVIFVNGRISTRSFRRFQRALSLSGGLLRSFLKRILNDASLCLMQSEADAWRLRELGAAAERVRVAGNLKYDLGTAEPTALSTWLEEEIVRASRYPVVVAGSLLASEEFPVLHAFAAVVRRYPRALLVVAPRKPDRFQAAEHILQEAHHKVVRRSALSINGTGRAILSDPASTLLLDTLGELASVYRLADVVFIGGSLVPAGGHNILEPASFGKTPVFGPSMDNFEDMAASFTQGGAAIQVKTPDELSEAWMALLCDAERSAEMGACAQKLVEQNRGATARVVAFIEEFLTKPEVGA